MIMFDLCSSIGGASDGFRKAGFSVITLDNNHDFDIDICLDIRYFAYMECYKLFPCIDVIWFSPPCDEFTLNDLPWHKELRKIPDMSIFSAGIKIIEQLKPKFWILENTRGAKKYFKPFISDPVKIGSRYLWGQFPIFDCDKKKCYGKWKLSPGKNRKKERSKIPLELSYNLACACAREL